MASISKKKKKVTVSNARKSILAEGKHVGMETEDWSKVNPNNYSQVVYTNLRHYSYFYDAKDYFKWGVEWVKANRTKEELKAFRASSEKFFSSTAAAFIKMQSNGAKLRIKDEKFVHRRVDEQIERGKKNLKEIEAEKDLPDYVKKTPADIVKERTSDMIAMLDGIIDSFGTPSFKNYAEFSLYEELQKNDAPYNMAKSIIDYYSPILEELQELIEKKTSDLVEAYSHLGPRKRKQFMNLVKSFIDDAEKYAMGKKAIRKPRKKKTTTTSQQVEKVKYLKSSTEFKLTSIEPINIIGAQEVYLFSTKYRSVIRLVSDKDKGFEIKGTTIQNIDNEQSYKKTIRKPEEFFTEFLKSTKIKARKTLETLSTKKGAVNGRLNDAMIILKAYV